MLKRALQNMKSSFAMPLLAKIKIWSLACIDYKTQTVNAKIFDKENYVNT